MLRTILFVALLQVLPVQRALALSSVDFYVATTGNDSNNGSVTHPFQTIQRVQQAVRDAKQLPANIDRPINVFFGGGRYALSSTLDFTTEDSGYSTDSVITYQAYCDPQVEAMATSTLQFPYIFRMDISQRSMWNGVGDKLQWTGPVDPFAQMGIDVAGNKLLTTPITPAPIASTDISGICVDKNGNGHTCYDDPLATCVSGCMIACHAHLERKIYSEELYVKFSHLFGKDLRKEEDCVEICSLSCRGCEQVTFSGAILLSPGNITTWALFQTFTNAESQVINIFRADLSPFLPVSNTTPGKPEDFTTFSSLYMDDKQLPRAGYPNCVVWSDSNATADSISNFNCSFAPVQRMDKPNILTFYSDDFSTNVDQWTSISDIQVNLRLNASDNTNLLYSVGSLDVNSSKLVLAAGGSELSFEMFTDGIAITEPNVAAFRVENVLEELDSPGEWFFDSATKFLYLVPLDSETATVTSVTNSEFEIPWLHQLIRVSGSKENRYVQAAHASTSLHESDSLSKVANLQFRHLTFSGTQLHHETIYEKIPGSPWPMARVGAIFIETVEHIVIEHCKFEKIGGNAIVVSGESDNVQLTNNNVSYVGSNGITILARRAYQRNSYWTPVLNHLLFSRYVNISFNQIHHIGRSVAHSAAIMVVAAQQTTIEGNLIYKFPRCDDGDGGDNITCLYSGASYFLKNANGATYDNGTPLIRPIAPISIPITLAENLSTQYVIAISLSGFDVPVVAKLIGAPECVSGSGRTDSLYSEPGPLQYTSPCSGCCSVHNNFARIRVLGSGVPWSDALSREIVVRPGENIELAATSAATFNSLIDVYIGFHVLTPNQIIELPTQAKWQILTRKCRYEERMYQETCFGPCMPSVSSSVDHRGCGNSNIAIQANGQALKCDDGFEADVYSHVCTGPFEAWSDCDGSGILAPHWYYNCSIDCFTTSCT